MIDNSGLQLFEHLGIDLGQRIIKLMQTPGAELNAVDDEDTHEKKIVALWDILFGHIFHLYNPWFGRKVLEKTIPNFLTEYEGPLNTLLELHMRTEYLAFKAKEGGEE